MATKTFTITIRYRHHPEGIVEEYELDNNTGIYSYFDDMAMAEDYCRVFGADYRVRDLRTDYRIRTGEIIN